MVQKDICTEKGLNKSVLFRLRNERKKEREVCLAFKTMITKKQGKEKIKLKNINECQRSMHRSASRCAKF